MTSAQDVLSNNEVQEMHEETKAQDNFDRLLKHLKDRSLAARLVQAHRASEVADPAESMKTVLRERLEQERKNLDGTEA